MRHHILMVADTKHYLPLSIREKLISASYDVTMIPANADAIYDVRKPISGIFIYADDGVISRDESLKFINNQALTVLVDRAATYDIPIFIAGYQAELKVLRGIIPKYLISHEFLRPIHINVAGVIDRFVKCPDVKVKKKILVVDDSGAMLRIIKAWLEDKYHVSLVDSGFMAIKYLVSNRPDLILLDYKMPVCDGKQVLEMIRSAAEYTDIPVMFLTSHASSEHIKSVEHLNPARYLIKTMTPSVLIKAVDDFFEQTKAK